MALSAGCLHLLSVWVDVAMDVALREPKQMQQRLQLMNTTANELLLPSASDKLMRLGLWFAEFVQCLLAIGMLHFGCCFAVVVALQSWFFNAVLACIDHWEAVRDEVTIVPPWNVIRNIWRARPSRHDCAYLLKNLCLSVPGFLAAMLSVSCLADVLEATAGIGFREYVSGLDLWQLCLFHLPQVWLLFDMLHRCSGWCMACVAGTTMLLRSLISPKNVTFLLKASIISVAASSTFLDWWRHVSFAGVMSLYGLVHCIAYTLQLGTIIVLVVIKTGVILMYLLKLLPFCVVRAAVLMCGLVNSCFVLVGAMETAAVAAVKQPFTAFAGRMWHRIKTGQQSERRRTAGVVSANSKRQQRGSKKQHADTVKKTDHLQGGSGSHSKNCSKGGNVSSSNGVRDDGKEAVGSWLSNAVQRPWQPAQVKRQEATVTPSMSSTASPAASAAKQSLSLGRASPTIEQELSRTRDGKSAGPKRAPGVSQGCQQPSAGGGVLQEADMDIGSGGMYQIKASKGRRAAGAQRSPKPQHGQLDSSSATAALSASHQQDQQAGNTAGWGPRAIETSALVGAAAASATPAVTPTDLAASQPCTASRRRQAVPQPRQTVADGATVKDTLHEQCQDSRRSLPAAKSRAKPQQLAQYPAAQLQSKAVAQASAGPGAKPSWARTAAAVTPATPTSSNAVGHIGQVATAAPAGAPDNAAEGQLSPAGAATTSTDVQLGGSSNFSVTPGRDHHQSGMTSRGLSNAVQVPRAASEAPASGTPYTAGASVAGPAGSGSMSGIGMYRQQQLGAIQRPSSTCMMSGTYQPLPAGLAAPRTGAGTQMSSANSEAFVAPPMAGDAAAAVIGTSPLGVSPLGVSPAAVSTAPSSSHKAAAFEDAYDECVVCLDATRTHALIHEDVAHLCLCLACCQALGYADEGSSRPCPMCNQPVLDVVDLAR